MHEKAAAGPSPDQDSPPPPSTIKGHIKGYTDPYKAKIKRLTGDIKEGWDDIKEGWDVLKPKPYPEGWVTPFVEAPGIPPTGSSRLPWVKPLFPGGKAKYERTQQQMPETTKPFDYEHLTPSSVNDQLLQNLPIPADDFVAEQRRNFERDGALNLEAGPRSGEDPLIDFDKRDRRVYLDTSYLRKVQASGNLFPPSWWAATNPEQRRILGLDPNELRENPKSEYSTQAPWSASVWKKIRGIMDRRTDDKPKDLHDGADTSKHKKWLDYSGWKGGLRRSGVDILGHELTHNYTGGLYDDSLGKFTKLKPGTSYITDRGSEYTQAATSGLNAMRDVTGEKINTPQQVHQLFDEIVADPVILDSIAPEHARAFRTYLTLRETNPELAEKLRNSMARDSQYLVENEPAGDPTVKKDVARV